MFSGCFEKTLGDSKNLENSKGQGSQLQVFLGAPYLGPPHYKLRCPYLASLSKMLI